MDTPRSRRDAAPVRPLAVAAEGLESMSIDVELSEDFPDGRGLQRLVAARYDALRRRLARRLGSLEHAQEALHETYLRIRRAPGPIADPEAYVLKAALNNASRSRRDTTRLARREEAYASQQLVEAGGAAPASAEGAVRIGELAKVVARLPERRRAILLAAALEATRHETIAERFEVSRRTVINELKRALAFCLVELEGRGAADRAVASVAGPARGSPTAP
jgi:RNA polymerase sigma-70 factor (ECF subfamily)